MRLWSAILMLALALFFSSCETKDNDHRILVSVADQSLALYHKATLLARYPVSTSKFGLGDHPGSRAGALPGGVKLDLGQAEAASALAVAGRWISSIT